MFFFVLCSIKVLAQRQKKKVKQAIPFLALGNYSGSIIVSVTELYLKHVCVFVMAVLHHHRLVAGQRERDAVLPPAVDGLQQQQ